MKKIIVLILAFAALFFSTSASAQEYDIWNLTSLTKYLSGKADPQFVIVPHSFKTDESNQAFMKEYNDCIFSLDYEKKTSVSNDVQGMVDKLKSQSLNEKIWMGVENMGNGYYAVTEDQKNWGVMTSDGEFTIPAEYKFPSRDAEKKLLSAKNDAGLCALMTYDGEKITDFKYYAINTYYLETSRLIVTDKGGNYMLVTLEGKEISPSYYEMEMLKVDGKWCARVGNKSKKYGLLNLDGKLVVTLKYDSIRKINEMDYGSEQDKNWVGGYVGSTSIDCYDPETLKLVKSLKQ